MFQDMNGTISNSTFLSWSDGSITGDRQIHLRPDGNTDLLASFCPEGDGTCVTEAKTRAADTILRARCPTASPTESPTASATGSPTAAPVALTMAPTVKPTDPEYSYEGRFPGIEEPFQKEIVEDNNEIWELFEGEDSGAGSIGSKMEIFALSSLATLTVMSRI